MNADDNDPPLHDAALHGRTGTVGVHLMNGALIEAVKTEIPYCILQDRRREGSYRLGGATS